MQAPCLIFYSFAVVLCTWYARVGGRGVSIRGNGWGVVEPVLYSRLWIQVLEMFDVHLVPSKTMLLEHTNQTQGNIEERLLNWTKLNACKLYSSKITHLSWFERAGDLSVNLDGDKMSTPSPATTAPHSPNFNTRWLLLWKMTCLLWHTALLPWHFTGLLWQPFCCCCCDVWLWHTLGRFDRRIAALK